MENKVSQFLEIIRKLPKEVDVFFSSGLNIAINSELINDYGITRDDLDEIVYDFFISGFATDKLSPIVSTYIKEGNESNKDKLICDFLGKLFLPIEPFIKKDISSAIEKYQGESKKYTKYIEGFNDLIDDKNLDELSNSLDYLEENFSASEEEGLVINFLERDLLTVLKDDDISGPRKINGSLIYLLINNKNSLNKFTKALMSNQEKLGEKKIFFSGKEHAPTISNWIKNFISEHGSEMFSNIILAKYLTSTNVVSWLSEDARKILRKVLKTYRNLIFFPDSMVNVPVESWEILPVDRDSDFTSRKINKIFDKGLVEVLKSEEKKTNISDSKKIEEATKDILPDYINLENQELGVLKELLKKYPNKSLERKAIESEMKKRGRVVGKS